MGKMGFKFSDRTPPPSYEILIKCSGGALKETNLKIVSPPQSGGWIRKWVLAPLWNMPPPQPGKYAAPEPAAPTQ